MELKQAIKKLTREAERIVYATRNVPRLNDMNAFAIALIRDLNNGETKEAARVASVLCQYLKREEAYRAEGLFRDPWPYALTWRACETKVKRYIGVLEQ